MSVAEIPLTRGLVAVVDGDLFEFLSQHKWHANAYGYAIRFVGRRVIWMHRVITNAPAGKSVDHINGNKHDNRRENLRVCSHAQNCRNHQLRQAKGSGKIGVSFHKKSKKWRAYITVDRRQIELGIFGEKTDAVTVRKAAEASYFGEFASRTR